MKLNRRDFLKGGVAVGGMAALGTMIGCAQESSAQGADAPAASADLPEKLTEQDFSNSVVEVAPITDFIDEKDYEIVVVGAGTAGVPAVYAALEEGAKVACITKESVPVANGNGSSGLLHEESNTVGERQYMQSWRKAGGYRQNTSLLDFFVANSGETAMWMIKRGQEVGFPPASSNKTTTEYEEGSYVTTIMNSFGPKPQNNQTIMTYLAEAAEKEGAEFFYSTPGVQLVTDDKGAVVGVIGKSEEGYIKFNASKAVIIAAGDYQNNDSMVERFSPDVVRFERKQVNKTGDGILMSMLAGAQLSPVNHAKTMHDMDAAPMFMTSQPFMALDEKGERFMNEDIPMESWDLALNERKDVEDPGRFFRIFDNDYMAKYGARTTIEALENYIPDFKEDPKGVFTSLIDTHRADTLEELAEMLDIPADALKKNVEQWNSNCANGIDEQFGLSKDLMKPIDTPPYWGVRQWIRCSAINSGVMIDGCCRVLDANDQPISGLYSVGSGAGNICGGLEWNLSVGGLCCGSYMTMGRYAAIHAVTGDMVPSQPAMYEEIKSVWDK